MNFTWEASTASRKTPRGLLIRSRAPQRAFSRQAASSPAMESEREEQEEDGERRRREHESEHESDGGAERRVAQASAQRASG